MRNGMRANERSFYLQHQSIYKLNQVMGNLRTITGAGINVMNTMLLTQIRNTEAARNLRDAQRQANESFASGDMDQYAKDMEAVNEIIEDQKNQVIQDTLAWVQMGLYLTSTILPILIKIGARMKGINRTPMIGSTGATPFPQTMGTSGGGGGSATQSTSKRAIVGRGIGVGVGGAVGARTDQHAPCPQRH